MGHYPKEKFRKKNTSNLPCVLKLFGTINRGNPFSNACKGCCLRMGQKLNKIKWRSCVLAILKAYERFFSLLKTFVGLRVQFCEK